MTMSVRADVPVIMYSVSAVSNLKDGGCVHVRRPEGGRPRTRVRMLRVGGRIGPPRAVGPTDKGLSALRNAVLACA